MTMLHLPIILFTTLTTSLGVGRAAASKFAAYGMGTCSMYRSSRLCYSTAADGLQMAHHDPAMCNMSWWHGVMSEMSGCLNQHLLIAAAD